MTRARRPDPQQQRRYDWLLRAALLVVALGVAFAGFLVLRNATDGQRPPEGSLIVNVNTATREELDSVPGVGPILAMQIISNRPYDTVDQLARVYGIVPEQVDEMRPYLKVNGATESVRGS